MKKLKTKNVAFSQLGIDQFAGTERSESVIRESAFDREPANGSAEQANQSTAVSPVKRTGKTKRTDFGRPRGEIDWDFVERCCEVSCSGTEIAAVLGVHPDTLYRACKTRFGVTFTAYSSPKKGRGYAMLKLKQWETALAGDTRMLIWLGKNYLGQSDNGLRSHQYDEYEIRGFIENIRRLAAQSNESPIKTWLSLRGFAEQFGFEADPHLIDEVESRLID